MSRPVFAGINMLPEPADAAQARRLLDDALDPQAAGDDEAREARRALADLAGAHPEIRRLLEAVFGGSSFLAGLVERDPATAVEVLETGAAPVVDRAIAALDDEWRGLDEAQLMRLLRRAKGRVALAVALGDLAGLDSLEDVTGALSRFADAALGASVDWLLAGAEAQGRFAAGEEDRPGPGSGYIVLAMGKYGAGELNYSSDIDLIVFYDPEATRLGEGVEPSIFFVRITRTMVKLLQERTGDGYVFRVDLRLRPDPRATNVAIAVEAAAQYYESLGQNWERAAMIKARPAAGDIAAGHEFLARLVPFIWRKYLDYAAIADVHSMKRQIHAYKGHGNIAVAGHNIKLGRGGIREIEFFVQTQQLIAGGRSPALRRPRTLEMLDVLRDNDWITPATADEMRAAYHFLRRIEHRLQMCADEQTHSLPGDDASLEAFARFAGFADAAALGEALVGHLRTVQAHYAALFEDAPALAHDTGSLVFTGGEDDPDTVATLQAMGFEKASEISATIRGWHFGRYAATRSARAREKLTEIMPALLQSLSRTADPDAAFIAFDRFLRGLPAGVQLFSLLWSNPRMLELIATVMGTAPRLSALLGQKPQVLDAVLDSGFFERLPDAAFFADAVTAPLRQAPYFEEALDRARVQGQEQRFRIGVHVLTGAASAREAGAAYSALADAVIDGLNAAVAKEMARQHGDMPGGSAVVVAMGKLGSCEMTAASDLDLMLIYDHEEGASSTGARSLMGTQYYARMTQRLIAALSAPTAEGRLYEVDMRLRPSGNSGPIATRIGAFVDYQTSSAWTWEKMALTRARVVAGDPALAEQFAAAVAAALSDQDQPERVAADVRDMRARIAREKPPAGPWDLKYAVGGLVDLEFIVQYLQIARTGDRPQLRRTNTAEAIASLGDAGVITREQRDGLAAACDLFHALTQVLRLCVEGRFSAERAPEGLLQLLMRAADVPDFTRLERELAAHQASVKSLFDEIVGSES